MRRKAGVAGIQKRQSESTQYMAVGRQLEDTKLSHVSELIQTFSASLTAFAEKHRHQINSDPQFRMQFHKMCNSIGVDPLASNKSYWSDLLGFGNFYFELGVVIIQASMSLKAKNGGMSSIDEILRYIKSSTSIGKKNEITEDDVLRAVEKLGILGNGIRVVTVKGAKYLVTVPMELNNDHEDLFALAQDGGFISESEAIHSLGWTKPRFDTIIQKLLREGFVWLDLHEGNLII